MLIITRNREARAAKPQNITIPDRSVTHQNRTKPNLHGMSHK